MMPGDVESARFFRARAIGAMLKETQTSSPLFLLYPHPQFLPPYPLQTKSRNSVSGGRLIPRPEPLSNDE
jgi:hypothetical protein